MRKSLVLLVAVMTAILVAGCGSGSAGRAEPFVGQWESTGGEQIAMSVDAPTDGAYPVRITGGDVDLGLSAHAAGDEQYEAESSTAVWTFRMVDDDLLNATVTPEDGAAVTTSFKRVGD